MDGVWIGRDDECVISEDAWLRQAACQVLKAEAAELERARSRKEGVTDLSLDAFGE